MADDTDVTGRNDAPGRHAPAMASRVLRRAQAQRRPTVLPTPALLFVAAVGAAALAVSAGALASVELRSADWAALAVFSALAAAAQYFVVRTGANHGYQTTTAFLVAGALVLPAELLPLFAVLSHLPAWLRDRYPWYIQAFNVSNDVLALFAAFGGAVAVSRSGLVGDARFAVAGIAAATLYVAVNHILLATMLRLARGHSFRTSALFSPANLLSDFVLGGVGIALALFWDVNPWLVPSLVAPLALSHRSFATLGRLRDSEERFRAIFDASPMGALLLGLDGATITTNRRFRELMHGRDAPVDEPLLTRVHPDDVGGIRGRFHELMQGESDRLSCDLRLVNDAGETVFAHLVAALVRDGDGKPQYAVAMIEDVTDERELEERLRQAQKLEAIGRLAGGVAHDFNNMLTAIGGYNSFALERAPADSPLRGDLQEIRKATERATLLTRQLLAFSRKQILQPELLSLNAIVLDLESMLRPLIGEDITLTTALDPTLGPVEADPGQLQQVVMNLVVNARDAMPSGGVLALETANVDVPEDDPSIAPGRYVTLTVRDSGHGIDEATLKQIFEPFFTTKDVGRGTGLGLATVYGIVKQSGGYVVVESEPAAGSAFTIYLPREAAGRVLLPEPVAAAAPVAVLPPPADNGAAANATVLLVEDEEVVRRLVRQVLETGGYRVLEAADGSAALALGSAEHVDLLLTDMVMPELGGKELAERLRVRTPELKVIFMSGYADGGLSDNGALQPGTELLEKPFAFADLLDRVRHVLDAT